MCGIAAAFWPHEARGRMAAALHAMARRGPDDQGSQDFALGDDCVSLGHKRLSVIDLSDGGHQPMHSADGRYAIVFNGEIYNYRELRQELAAAGMKFRTASDTEVLLAAWALWGDACLSRLTGMFAFCLFDRQCNTLTAVRDAFGIKPLFYCREGPQILMASDLAGLRALKAERPRLDWQRSYDYLAHGDYDSGASSFIEGVQHLPPGHLLRVALADGQLEIAAWWQARIAPVSPLSFADAAQALRDGFLASLRLHLRSDVPLGAALSGGIDSSAIVCGMRHVAPDAPIHTFSFIAEGSAVSEEPWVDLANTHARATAHKVVVAPADLARDLDDLIATQGEPFGSTSIYAQYRVFQHARAQGITVTLDGQGADELLAGYDGYPGQRLRSLLDTGQVTHAAAFLRNWARWPGRSIRSGVRAYAAANAAAPWYGLLRQASGASLQPQWLRPGVLAEAGVQLRYPAHRPAAAPRGRRVAAALADAISRRGLPALLRHGDRNSMRFSVESRVPFLTTNLADFLLSLPEHYLIGPHGETKRLLRAALRGIVPDAILDRRDKVGFVTPEQDWLRQIAPQAREWLREDTGLPFLDQRKVLDSFDAMMQGTRPFSWQAWRWINFTRWYNRHLSA